MTLRNLVDFVSAENGRGRYIATAIVLLGVCLFAYSNALNNPFFLDDEHMLLERIPAFRGHSFFLHFSLYDSPRVYRPAASIFWSIQHSLFKSNVLGYHACNLALFYVACLLMFILLNYLNKDFLANLIATLFFCSHPINAVLINFVGTNNSTFLLIFSELSLIAAWLSQEEKRHSSVYYWAGVGFFILALLCHETAITVPLVLAGMLYVIKKYNLKKTVLVSLPFILTGLGYLTFRLYVASLKTYVLDNFLLMRLGIGVYIASFVDLIGWYIGKLLFPFNIIFMKHIPTGSQDLVGVKIALLVLACAICLLLLRRWKKDVRSFALFWFLAGLLPAVVGILAYAYQGPTLEPHWFLFFSIGYFILAAIFLSGLRQNLNKKVWIMLMGCLLLFLCLKTREYNALWKTEKGYCQYWLRLSPGNPIAAFRLGVLCANEGEAEEALYYFRKVLELGSYQRDKVFGSMGLIYVNRHDFNRARENLLKAVEANPSYAWAWNLLGTIDGREENYDGAERNFKNAVERDPNFLPAILNLGDLYSKMGKVAMAIEMYEMALGMDSLSPADQKDILSKLAIANFQRKNADKSLKMVK